MLYAYDYVSQHGIALKEDYPMQYLAAAGKCMTDSKHYKGQHFRNISEVEKDRMTNTEMR
jgi:hypothetical protein